MSIYILWHDDEHDRETRSGLAVWKRWLQGLAPHGAATLTCTSTSIELASELARADRNWALLILDVMLKDESERTYALLGFPSERVLRTNAGLQIAALLRNRQFDGKRPAWLQRLASKPLILLSHAAEPHLLEYHLGHTRHQGVQVLSKSLELSDESFRINPQADEAMRRALADLLAGDLNDTL
jgi:hypothetical protein